ncbi:protein kinase domain-containing protein [Streptomyces chartreusis]|uniref:protein kinase domain-containing protein n=1 Tax=Streptomyces chartreusis TaxID=1969 RepID=UPI0033C55039
MHFPAHALRVGTDSMLTASSDGSGNRVAVHRTDLTSRDSEPLTEVRLGEVFGLAERHGTGPLYLLGSLPDNDHTRARPTLMRLTGHRIPTSPETASSGPAAHVADGTLVRQTARGERRDYRLDRLPLNNDGGQAQVFRAEHKASGTVVAFKRRRGQGERDLRRMRREVEAALRFGAGPHVMPVLDFSPTHDWFVMPLAEATVEDKRTDLQNPTHLRALVDAVAAGVADAHRYDWIHRDIKPSNVPLLDGRWVVADWGIVRRSRGQTSTAGLLTRAGTGTEGFAAPELSVDGHDITPPATSTASDSSSVGSSPAHGPRPTCPYCPHQDRGTASYAKPPKSILPTGPSPSTTSSPSSNAKLAPTASSL